MLAQRRARPTRRRISGSGSISFMNGTKAARPKAGRPLQRQQVQRRHGFVEASPSRVFGDGEGMLRFKLTHYRISGQKVSFRFASSFQLGILRKFLESLRCTTSDCAVTRPKSPRCKDSSNLRFANSSGSGDPQFLNTAPSFNICIWGEPCKSSGDSAGGLTLKEMKTRLIPHAGRGVEDDL